MDWHVGRRLAADPAKESGVSSSLSAPVPTGEPYFFVALTNNIV